MYKIKLINYRPYEYELFQEALDKLGKDGYQCHDLSLISIFKKTNQPIYYKIDFFKQTGKTKNEKNILKDKFYDPYLDCNYEAVYAKKDMYVFMGETKADININWKQKEDIISEKNKVKNLNYFIVSLLVTFFFTYFSSSYINIDTFSSYGITITYVGILCLGITAIYRNFLNLRLSSQFDKMLKNKKHHFNLSQLKKLRIIYIIAFFLSIILITGGLVEDTLNAKTFSLKEHPVLSLGDLGIDEDSELSYHQQSSFTVPHSYSMLEVGNEDSVLYVKEYVLRSQKSATKLYQDLYNNPDEYLCTSVSQKDQVIYGYYENDLTTLIIQNNKQITFVSVTFKLTQDQINTIIQYYR